MKMLSYFTKKATAVFLLISSISTAIAITQWENQSIYGGVYNDDAFILRDSEAYISQTNFVLNSSGSITVRTGEKDYFLAGIWVDGGRIHAGEGGQITFSVRQQDAVIYLTDYYNADLPLISAGSEMSSRASKIQFLGNVLVDSQSTYTPIQATYDGQLIFTKDLTISSRTGGIYAARGGQVEVRGSLYMTASSTAYDPLVMSWESSRVKLSGGTLRSQNRNAALLQASTYGEIEGKGKFNLEGEIISYGGIINLTLENSSSFVGMTKLFEGGYGESIINLTLKSGSNWTLTGASSVTSLTLGSSASLTLNNYDWLSVGDFTLEAGSILRLNDNADALVGIAIDLFTINGSFNDYGMSLVSKDGYSLDYLYLEYGTFLILDINSRFSANSLELSNGSPLPIPEPGTVTLGLIALMAACNRRKRP